MQVTFETMYAAESQNLRTKQLQLEATNKQQLDRIVELGTNIQSNAQGL